MPAAHRACLLVFARQEPACLPVPVRPCQCQLPPWPRAANPACCLRPPPSCRAMLVRACHCHAVACHACCVRGYCCCCCTRMHGHGPHSNWGAVQNQSARPAVRACQRLMDRRCLLVAVPSRPAPPEDDPAFFFTSDDPPADRSLPCITGNLPLLCCTVLLCGSGILADERNGRSSCCYCPVNQYDLDSAAFHTLTSCLATMSSMAPTSLQV